MSPKYEGLYETRRRPGRNPGLHYYTLCVKCPLALQREAHARFVVIVCCKASSMLEALIVKIVSQEGVVSVVPLPITLGRLRGIATEVNLLLLEI